MFFVQDYRERIKEENPNASFGEVGKLLGAKWKEMSDAEKKVRDLSSLRSGSPLTSSSHTRSRLLRTRSELPTQRPLTTEASLLLPPRRPPRPPPLCEYSLSRMGHLTDQTEMMTRTTTRMTSRWDNVQSRGVLEGVFPYRRVFHVYIPPRDPPFRFEVVPRPPLEGDGRKTFIWDIC